MGSKGSRIVKVNGNFKETIKNYLKDEKLKIEIIEFFNNSQVRNYNPNGQRLNPDRPMIKKYFLNDDKIMIEIYNYPALLSDNYGFFNLINECSAIIKIFFQRCSDLTEKNKKEKFLLFYNSIIEKDNKKIFEMTGLELNKENFIGLKQGLDKLEEYFGMSNLQNYFASKKSENDNNINIDSSIFGGYFTIGKCIILYLINYFFGSKKETILNEDPIVQFVKLMDEELIKDEVLNETNLFVVALEKTKDNNVTEICMFPYYIGKLNENRCPTIGIESPSTNQSYYYNILKGIQFYKKKYKNMKDGDFDELKKDIKFLITATKEEIIEVAEEKEKEKKEKKKKK